MSSGEVTGSSKSLNITASAIKQFMEITAKRPKDIKLRDWVYSLLGAFGEDWYKRGVRRGHRQSYKQYKAIGRVSSQLRYEQEKELFTDVVRRVIAISRIKRRHR